MLLNASLSIPHNQCPLYKCSSEKAIETSIPTSTTCLSGSKTQQQWELIFSQCVSGYNCAEAETIISTLSSSSSESLTVNCTLITSTEEDSTVENFSLVELQKCHKDYHCATGMCVSGYCTGFPEGSTCVNHKICSIGYFCSSTNPKKPGVCTAQVAEGSRCSSDYDCVNTCGCKDGYCTSYYSLPVGSPSTSENFCESVLLNSDNEGNSWCDYIYLTEESCTETTDKCLYTWEHTKEVYTGISDKCSCGLVDYEDRFCQDAPVGEKGWILNTSHTLLRFFDDPYYIAPSPYTDCISSSINGSQRAYFSIIIMILVIIAVTL